MKFAFKLLQFKIQLFFFNQKAFNFTKKLLWHKSVYFHFLKALLPKCVHFRFIFETGNKNVIFDCIGFFLLEKISSIDLVSILSQYIAFCAFESKRKGKQFIIWYCMTYLVPQFYLSYTFLQNNTIFCFFLWESLIFL